MTDYKELIEMLRHQVINDDDAAEIADAIEQLVADNESYKCALADLHNEIANYCETIATLEKERDAAVADLKDHGRNCKTCLHGGRGKNDCLDREEVPCKWEWRGVQEVEHEADARGGR